jgi:hypothetical protein
MMMIKGVQRETQSFDPPMGMRKKSKDQNTPFKTLDDQGIKGATQVLSLERWLRV